MLSFQRRLDLLDHIPRYPSKISTRQLLILLEANGHEDLIMRKIQRDLEAIEAMGMFGLEVDKRSKPYGWSINSNWKKLNISLMDANTALAFSTLQEVAGGLLPEPTLRELQPYFEKADVIIESEKSPLISHWKNSVALISSANPVSLPLPDEESLAKIKHAIYYKKQISASLKRYILANRDPAWKHYQHINPLGLIQRDHLITLICSFGSFHQKVYKYPIAFIKDVELNDTDINVPDNFDFEYTKNSYFKSRQNEKWISLSLLIRKDSHFVMSNGKLSEDQATEPTEHADMVKITATVEDNPKLRAFLRGLGGAVEVLAPHSLRVYFKELAQELLNKYQ